MANEFPEFWPIIERALFIDPNGIKEIKLLLTSLNYTTIQSVTKFASPKEIKLIELEFLNRKTQLVKDYPALENFTFGSGVSHILQDIALKVKRKFVNERTDADIERILVKVLSDGEKVFFFFVSSTRTSKSIVYVLLGFCKFDKGLHKN